MIKNKKLFIIMPMSKDNPSYEDTHFTIKNVAASLNIEAFRIDEDQSNERITDRILSSINDSDYIVADLTDSRPNVFYEAGYAHGIGKIPVFIAKEGTKIEFDVKDYQIIFFENQVKLRNELLKRLQKLVSDKPNKPVARQEVSDIITDENDIKTLLAGWAQRKINSNSIIETFYFKDIDIENRIADGNSKKFLSKVVTGRWSFNVDAEGPNTIKFKLRPQQRRGPRVIHPGFNSAF